MNIVLVHLIKDHVSFIRYLLVTSLPLSLESANDRVCVPIFLRATSLEELLYDNYLENCVITLNKHSLVHRHFQKIVLHEQDSSK